MRYWYFLLFSFLVVSANAQFIYVQSWQESIGGWIVSPEGETVYEIPAGWRPEEHNAPMAEVKAWPLLLRWRKSGEPIRYAFITKGMEWQPITNYKTAITLGKDRFKGFLPENNNAVLLNGMGETIGLDTFRDIRQFDRYATSIAIKAIAPQKAKFGLIDTMGEWIIQPDFANLYNMGQDRYLGHDNLGHQYLLQPRRDIGIWDTLIDLEQKKWFITTRWTFDETGHTWIKLSDGYHHLINLHGELVGDTVVVSKVRPLSEGIGMTSNNSDYSYVDQEGHFLNTTTYPSATAYSEGFALVEDATSNYFGYLNSKGEWALEPNYCYATSFRNGWAVVAPAIPENCSTLRRGRGGDRHIPPSLHHTRRVSAYQLIDTLGKVIWADSCRELYLPAKGIVGVNYSYNQLSPALSLRWLNESKSWISPDFTVSRWSQLDSLKEHTIKRINLGVRRFDQLYDQNFKLPEGFVDRLSHESMQQLEELNLDAHHLTPQALEAIFALPALRKLSLGYNSLEALPTAIKQLDQLEILDLSGTKFTSLPKTIYRMRHLQKLIIIDTELPAETIPRLRNALPDTEIVFKHEW